MSNTSHPDEPRAPIPAPRPEVAANTEDRSAGPEPAGAQPAPPAGGRPHRRRTSRRLLLAILVVLVLLGTGAGVAWALNRPERRSAVLVAAVGDLACSPRAAAAASSRASPRSPAPDATNVDGDGPGVCREGAVSQAILAGKPAALLALGDLQYETGAPQDWAPYDRSYGRLKDRTWPVPGNHEYLTQDATGYYAYFGDRAGPAGRGYYSFDVGGWHFVALNSQCTPAGGCGVNSPQMSWLRADLTQRAARCTIAYWHIPRFSSGQHGDHSAYRALWRTLAEHGVDLVLAGHDHNYERLAPLDADGKRDDKAGIRSFVVGTGGRNLRRVNGQREGSERVIQDSFGFLELELRETDYTWRFRDTDRKVLDEGTAACR